MIYCSKDIEGIQSCWNRYGTCQHDHVPGIAARQFPGNVTIIPGLTMNDAKRAPICTRERTICHCRTSTCESTSSGTKEKPWCFLSNLRNPNNPTQNCYMDVRWSATYGSFYSHEACVRLRNSRQRLTYTTDSKQLNLRSGVESQVPVLDNFDNVASQQLPQQPESSSTPNVNPSTSPSTNPPQQNLNLPPQNMPQQNLPEQNSPQQNSPQQNSPQQNSPSQNRPQQTMAQQNMAQQNLPQQNLPPQNSPQQISQQQNAPQQNAPQQNSPQQNLSPLPSENDFYWNFEEESGQEPAASGSGNPFHSFGN